MKSVRSTLLNYTDKNAEIEKIILMCLVVSSLGRKIVFCLLFRLLGRTVTVQCGPSFSGRSEFKLENNDWSPELNGQFYKFLKMTKTDQGIR